MQLVIRKPSDGGYLVSESVRDDFGHIGFMFACTTIDEALRSIKSKLEPKPAK